MTATADFVRSSRALPGPRDWILDLFGSFVREAGGWIAVSDLLDLLSLVDVTPPSARSALSRMKGRGELEASERGGRRGYELTEAAELWFRDGTDRIMQAPPATADGWAIVSFTVPESDRKIRYKLRTRLLDLGFGQVGRGLMIAPGHLADETQHALSAEEYRDCVLLWHADLIAFGDERQLVAGAWDLDDISSQYERYLVLATELSEAPKPRDDREAFVRYLVNVNAWRDLPFVDPGISLDFLPEGWPSREARALFSGIADSLRPAAWRHFRESAS